MISADVQQVPDGNPNSMRKPLPSLNEAPSTTASTSTTSINTCVLILGSNSVPSIDASYNLACADLRLVPILLVEENLAEALRTHSPALVLIDWDTLGETALKTCLFLRHYLLGKGTPIAITSRARGCDGSIMRAFSSGADDFIADAARPRLLMSRIKALLRVRQSFQLEWSSSVAV